MEKCEEKKSIFDDDDDVLRLEWLSVATNALRNLQNIVTVIFKRLFGRVVKSGIIFILVGDKGTHLTCQLIIKNLGL